MTGEPDYRMLREAIPLKPFYMARHGQTEANRDKVFSGQQETPLTELGQHQAQRLATTVQQASVRIEHIVHSDLSRAQETALPVAKLLGLPTIEHKAWKEIDYGDWQGQPHEKIMPMRKEGVPPPNGETDDLFFARIAGAAMGTLVSYDNPLIVCHGGCFRAFAGIYGLEARNFPNAVLHEFVPAPERKVFPWEVYIYDPDNGERLLSPQYEDALESVLSATEKRAL